METSLSGRDQRILAEIESVLSEDRALDRCLRTMRPRPRLRLRHRPGLLCRGLPRRLGTVIAATLGLAVACIVIAVCTGSPAAWGAAGGCWLTAGAAVFLWLCRHADHNPDTPPHTGHAA
jgi:hypothetical protein